MIKFKQIKPYLSGLLIGFLGLALGLCILFFKSYKTGISGEIVYLTDSGSILVGAVIILFCSNLIVQTCRNLHKKLKEKNTI